MHMGGGAMAGGCICIACCWVASASSNCISNCTAGSTVPVELQVAIDSSTGTCCSVLHDLHSHMSKSFTAGRFRSPNPLHALGEKALPSVVDKFLSVLEWNFLSNVTVFGKRICPSQFGMIEVRCHCFPRSRHLLPLLSSSCAQQMQLVADAQIEPCCPSQI